MRMPKAKIIQLLLSFALFSVLKLTFATSNSVLVAQTTPAPTITTLTKPVISEAAVMAVAQNAALAIFNYDYQNYRQRLGTAATYFTPLGWTSYLKALTESGNLAVMQQHKVTMAGRITGTTTISKLPTSNNTAEEWMVQMPMQVIYTNGRGDKIIHNLIVRVFVTTVDVRINPRGIAVTRIIAAPDVSSSSILNPNPPSQ